MTSTSLLHQPIPEGMRDEWALHLAKRVDHDDHHRVSLMVFGLGTEHFCLPATVIEEIVVPGVVCALPHKKDSIIRGVTNVRGSIVVCVWLEKILQSSPAKDSGERRMMVFNHNGWRVAALVDTVRGMREFEEDYMKELPPTHAGEFYSKGFFDYEAGAVVARLDEERMFAAMRKQVL